MGYDMRTVKGNVTFTANSALMENLRVAIVESGVNLHRYRARTNDPAMGYKQAEGNLMVCFATNAGWLVTEEEAEEIAEKVDAALIMWMARPKKGQERKIVMLEVTTGKKGNTKLIAATPYDPLAPLPTGPEIGADDRLVGQVQKFAAFCRKASKRRGFYVY